MKNTCRLALMTALTFLLHACSQPVKLPPPAPVPSPPPKVALVLGGGAAKGFAHIGVIKALEAQGIVPDMVVGTSAGAVVGVLYAGGYNGFELQKIAMQLDEAQVSDWGLPDRGLIKGEALQAFINKTLQGRTLEKLNRTVGVVATDLNSGEAIVFRTGDAGMAVRASASVPGVFQPVGIQGREYVDGGLVSPVPVRAARAMGADIIIAVDISSRPAQSKTRSTLDVLMQTFAIMGQSISRQELVDASVVIRPAIHEISSTDFQTRHLAVFEGEKAAAALMPQIKAKLQKLRGG
ncbi:MAG: hypothetical protein RIR70_800 [Pseudomonadota bacterium]